MINPKVDLFLSEGCGRCNLAGTLDCKVRKWTKELELLRFIMLDCGLTEELKWGVPCYMHGNTNILLVSAFKHHCAISFFKGALLSDTDSILEMPGENSQAIRTIKFTDTKKIIKLEDSIKAYVFEAIEIENAGLKIEFKQKPAIIPPELQQKFNEDPIFKTAFEELTLGRQRNYILYFSQAKQSKTRVARIEKYALNIMRGEGLNDIYRTKK